MSIKTTTDCERVIYPPLPELPNIESNSESPLKTISNMARPSRVMASPPNIGRQRSGYLSSLSQSPPRPSYSQQMTGIFASSERQGTVRSPPPPKSALDEPRLETLRCEPHIESVKTTKETYDRQSINLRRSRRDSATQSNDLMDMDPDQPMDTITSDCTGYPTRDSEQVLPPSPSRPIPLSPVRLRENTFPSHQPSTPGNVINQTSSTSSKRPRMAPSPSIEDVSSEEWTGDEDFFLRSARRRHRQQRLAAKRVSEGRELQPLFSQEAVGSPLRRVRAPACASPGPSRFFGSPVAGKDSYARSRCSLDSADIVFDRFARRGLSS